MQNKTKKMEKKAREYQAKNITEIRHGFARYKRQLYCLPTGAGKTFVSSSLAQMAVQRGKKVLFVAHRTELLKQAEQVLPEQVRVHSVFKKYQGETPDLIIIDEAHHTPARQWMRILEQFPQAYVLGVTATPCRLDGQPLNFYENMVLGPDMAELIAQGHLSKFLYYAPEAPEDGRMSQRKLDDWLAQKPEIVGDAVREYTNRCAGRAAVAFCCNKKHAEFTAQQFRSAGYRAYALTSDVAKERREQMIEQLGTGQIDVLCSCDIISEGTDIPTIEVAILLRRTQSVGLYLQQVGRALRVAQEKQQAYILDMVGNAGRWIKHEGERVFLLRHGFPDSNREWSLEKGVSAPKREKGEIEAVMCADCWAWYAPAPCCPSCGAARPRKERKLQYTQGELAEAQAQVKVVKMRTEEDVKRAARREEGQCKSLEDWQRLAKKRGYKQGWAFMRYKARAGKRSL